MLRGVFDSPERQVDAARLRQADVTQQVRTAETDSLDAVMDEARWAAEPYQVSAAQVEPANGVLS